MRLQRRLVFAAPFVVVVACKKPVHPSPPEDEGSEGDESVHEHDRAELPPDAAIADTAPDASRVATDCSDPRTRPPCNVNPPRPGFDDRAGPRPIDVRVIAVSIDNSRTVVHVGAGTAQGVANSWVACLTNDAHRCLDGGDLTLVRVGTRDSVLFSTLTQDQIKASPYVRLAERPALLHSAQVAVTHDSDATSRYPMNPPKPIDARIVTVQVTGSETIATLDRGADYGISRASQACLVARNDTCVRNGDIVIIRVDKHTTVVKSKLPLQQAANPVVRLSVP